MRKIHTSNKLLAAIVIAASSFAAPAYAEECKDILVDGTFRNVNWQEKSYYQNLLYARFASLSYDQSKTDMGLSAPVPIGKAVIGKLEYSQSEFYERKREIENTLFKQLTDSRELSVVMSSGDETIIGAWKDCISRRGGGLAVTVKPLTTTVAEVSVEYFAVRTDYQTELAEDADLINDNGRLGPQDIEIITNAACLKKGAKLAHNGDPCVSRIKLRDAKTPVVIALRTANNQTAYRYLPPRLRPGTAEPKGYQFTPNCGPGSFPSDPEGASRQFASFAPRCPDFLFRAAKRGTAAGAYTVTLSPELLKEGWRFDSESASLSLQVPRGNGHRGSKCSSKVESVSQTDFKYSIDAWSPGNANMTIICYVAPSIMMRRETFIESL
jgi:hypothetical protein